jgi:LacI family transcriptional regulator
MSQTKRITLRDVAERAGVSTAAVSYVINNGPRPTSIEVRERVLQAVAELNYHPNGFARGLRAKRTHTIAFVANDFNPLESFASHYLASILSALTGSLQEHGHYLLMFPLKIGDDPRAIEALLHSGRLDGIALRLVQDSPQSDEVAQLIANSQLPCVCVERPAAERFRFAAITYNDAAGANAAAQHLIDRGHRRIATISGDMRYATARGRLAGFEQGLRDSGLKLDPELNIRCDWSTTLSADATNRFLDLETPPTAIFAASDDMAIGAINAARERGLRVPEDIAIVGFDDIPLSQEINPLVSTVRIPLAEMGQRVAQLLVDPDALAAQGGVTEVFPVELIQRSSS